MSGHGSSSNARSRALTSKAVSACSLASSWFAFMAGDYDEGKKGSHRTGARMRRECSRVQWTTVFIRLCVVVLRQTIATWPGLFRVLDSAVLDHARQHLVHPAVAPLLAGLGQGRLDGKVRQGSFGSC